MSYLIKIAFTITIGALTMKTVNASFIAYAVAFKVYIKKIEMKN